ncbi:MAG: NADH-quinone oxidoreductase subunit NuoF [Pelagibacterales bacterium]|nr:NADH-quinone oxidoreductase subunit NuoF [Pelagibacterales bacterium]
MNVKICTETFGSRNPSNIETYIKLGGYQAWKNILKNRTSKLDIISKIKNSGLRGKGGAGFLTGLKWSFIPPASNKQKYLVCNSDESEPGTCKDRDILRYNPHSVIEGMLIACYAIGATVGYNYLRGEFINEQWIVFNQALKDAYENNLVGNNILSTNISVNIFALIGAGAYIVGEETAMLESIEGKRGMPRIKPPFPAIKGLFGQPTIINNTETLSTVPKIILNGDDWYKNIGIDSSEGVKMFSMSGHISKPGNYEIPLGTPFSKLLELSGGMLNSNKIKAVIPGGSSVPVVKGEVMMETNMDYASILKAGSMLGSGGVIVMDESTCMVSVLHRISRFYYAESCGQCTPCREGTGWLYKILTNIINGKATNNDLEQLDRIASQIEGHCICALGDAAAMPVRSFIKNFWTEFEYYIDRKESMVS